MRELQEAYRTSVVRFKHESSVAKLDIYSDKSAKVSGVYSRQKGLGHARAMFTKLVEYADEHDLYLYLDVQAYGPPNAKGLTNLQLIKFYSSFGFQIGKYHPHTRMYRNPQTKE